MLTRRTLLGATLALAAVAATVSVAPQSASAAGGKKAEAKHVLVVTVTKGFRHDSIPDAEKTIEMLGTKTGAWTTDFVRTDEEMAAKMTREALKKVDVIIFANTTGVLPLPEPKALLDFVADGKGFVAMHSGSDTFHQWPEGSQGGISEYVKMLGAEFEIHHRQCAVDGLIYDPKHPALAAIAKAAAKNEGANPTDEILQKNTVATGNTWKAFDEIYLFKNIDREALHVLLATDKHPNDGVPEANQPGEYLLSWVKSYGKGRVFYTSLGHRKEMWADPLYQKHITGGILFALGVAKGNTKPNEPYKAAK